MDKGQEEDWWGSRFIVILAIVSVITLVAFVWRELATNDPVVHLRVFKCPEFTAEDLVVEGIDRITRVGDRLDVPWAPHNDGDRAPGGDSGDNGVYG